jgi:hypothetical protein
MQQLTLSRIHRPLLPFAFIRADSRLNSWETVAFPGSAGVPPASGCPAGETPARPGTASHRPEQSAFYGWGLDSSGKDRRPRVRSRFALQHVDHAFLGADREVLIIW